MHRFFDNSIMQIIVQSGLSPLAEGIAQARGTIDGKLYTLIEYPSRLSVYGGKHVVQVIGDHRVGLFRLAVDIDGVVREGNIPDNFFEMLRSFVYKE